MTNTIQKHCSLLSILGHHNLLLWLNFIFFFMRFITMRSGWIGTAGLTRHEDLHQVPC